MYPKDIARHSTVCIPQLKRFGGSLKVLVDPAKQLCFRELQMIARGGFKMNVTTLVDRFQTKHIFQIPLGLVHGNGIISTVFEMALAVITSKINKI